MRRANQQRFGDPDYVRSYQLADRYHRIRIELAIEMVMTRVDLGPRPRVLDVGTGNGVTAEELARRGAWVVAGDVLAGGQRRFGLSVSRVQFDAARPFPFAPGSFNGILVGDVIQNLFDPVTFLRECRRVLCAKGVLVLTTPNLVGLQDRVRFLAGRSPRQIDPTHDYMFLHIRPFSLDLLTECLQLAGLRRVEVRSNAVVLRWGARRYGIRWLARLWPSLGNVLVVAAVPDGAAQSERGQ
ncbi:MAG TPA: class I SAM-dependent methyltransferase [Mycobacterium sp.]|nr:class I SAM-dependent methyltransferase [Mycobacterium sp.]